MINANDMQSWAYLLAPTFQFVNTAGKPLTEGWIEVYIAGTRNKYYCASDFNGTLHPFQIPLDSLGANIVLADPVQAYDVYVYNKYGSLVMSRYHVSPGMAGGSGVLNITITSEDGTVSVNNDGNGNFDLSIQDTIDRIDVLEQTVSGLSSNSSVGYAIAHAYTVELDGSFDLINDAVTGIGYTPNMDGFRLKSGHVYQFNFNALFENGEFDRNCSGKLYLEGPNTIAQEWKFDLDDSYYHSQSINGSTVLVTPNDLNYYDVKLKLAWDVDYPNKPNVDLNKISIVDITTILSTTVSGVGGNYTGGDGILVNDETYVISVDMDYINSHLNIDATEIIASAVNIATAYTDARVTSVSGDLVNLIAEVSASIPTGTVTKVQSDWTEQDTSSPAYIQHKPDLTVYATHNEFVSAVTAVSSMIPTDYVTHNEVSAVSANLVNYVNSVSGDITNYVDESIVSAINVATGSSEQVQSDWNQTNTSSVDYIKNKPEEYGLLAGDNISITASGSNYIISAVATGSFEQVQSDWTEDDTNNPAYIKNKPEEYGLLAGDNISITASGNNFIISSTASASSGVNYQAGYGIDITGDTISVVSSIIPDAQINSDWTATSGKAEILNKPNESELIAGAGVSITASGSNYIISAVVTGYPIISGYVTEAELQTVSGNIVNQIPDVSNLATKQELSTVSASIPDISGLATNADLQIVSASIPDVSNLATKSELQTVSASIPDVSNFVTGPTVSAIVDESLIDVPSGVSGVVAGDGISITASGSNYVISCNVTGGGDVTRADLVSVSGTLESQIQTVSGAIVDIPTGVSGVVAGEGIAITASGSNYVISCTVTGGGSGTTYTAGDYIGIVDDTISVTGVTDVVAGNCVSITSSGNSAVIDWSTTGGITDIQIVNSLPSSPLSTVLYLIPET